MRSVIRADGWLSARAPAVDLGNMANEGVLHDPLICVPNDVTEIIDTHNGIAPVVAHYRRV
jgi:hypothetical protein